MNRRSCRSKDLPPGIQPDCPCACLTLRTGLLVVLARYGLDASSPRERSYGSRPLRALPLTCSCMPAHRTVERCRCYPHWSNSTGSGEGAHSVAHKGNHLTFSKKPPSWSRSLNQCNECIGPRQKPSPDLSFRLKRQKAGSNHPPGHCWLIRCATRQTAIVGSKCVSISILYGRDFICLCRHGGGLCENSPTGHHFCGGE